MRGFLIFLALAFPVAVTNPLFWSLVAMEWSASPVTYVNRDGSAQQATVGPKSFWPEWAITPDGADLRVKSWFGPSPTSAATGIGEFNAKQEPGLVLAAYLEKLRVAGWAVETGRFEGPLPEIPPRKLIQCRIRAVRGAQLISAAIEFAPEPGKGSLFWVDTPASGTWPLPHGTADGPC